MTRVLTATERAEALAAEGERNRHAWNLPRQPVRTTAHAAPGSQELDWKGFLAAYFPGSRRHDLAAITAYGAYKRSRVVDGQSVTGASRPPAAEGAPARATAVAAWEDEGGASL